MARKNRRGRRPQHAKPKRTSKRPRGWHRSYQSENVKRGVRWLEGQEAA